MSIRMQPDRMTFVCGFFHILVVFRMIAGHKEGRFRVILVENIQDLFRVGARSIIKGQIDNLFP